jgi:arsenate reductase-like glutaredoxin family protein
MSNDLKNILANSNKDIDNQSLMDYLGKHLSKEKLQEVEQQMAADEFMNDAVEGLQEINNQKNIPALLDQLHADLQKQIGKQKKQQKRRWKDEPTTYISIIIILLLMIVGFVVIKKYQDKKPSSPSEIKIGKLPSYKVNR